MIVAKKADEEVLITKSGIAKKAELFPNEDDFDALIAKTPLITQSNDEIIFRYKGKLYGSFKLHGKYLSTVNFYQDADSFEFKVCKNSYERKNYVLIDGEAHRGTIFHNKIFYADKKTNELVIFKR